MQTIPTPPQVLPDEGEGGGAGDERGGEWDV